MVNLIEGDEDASISINKAFNSKQAADRKKWLEAYRPRVIKQYSNSDPICDMDISELLMLT